MSNTVFTNGINLEDNFCIDCGHIHYTPFWFIMYDSNLTGWRHFLCQYCVARRLSEKSLEYVGCYHCKKRFKFEKIFEHRCKRRSKTK